MDSLHEADGVTAPHLRDSHRWLLYVPVATTMGVQSQLAVKLLLDNDGVLGGLNLYSTISEELDPDAEPIAALFAAHAAITLGNAQHREQLNDALQSRKVIGQALANRDGALQHQRGPRL